MQTMIVSETGNQIRSLMRDWRTVHAEVQACGGRRAELDALEVRLVREAESLRIWTRVGCATMLAYLERELGYSPRQGRERLRIARALAKLPELEACLASGELKHCAIRELTRVATPATERAWLERVRGKALREIEELVAGRSPGDTPDDPPAPLEERAGPMVYEDIAPETRALERQVRVMLADELGGSLDDDAFLAALFGTALERASGGNNRPSHQIAVTECKCGRGWQHGGGRKFELDAAALERARCDATFIGSIDANKPERATSDITPAVRRFVYHRDSNRCQVPGCRSTRFLDLHHLLARALGGSHTQENLITLCGAHHKQAHRGILIISGRAPDQVKFVFADAALPPITRQFSDVALETQTRDALVSLGFTSRVARDAIALARPQLGEQACLEDLIREALKQCPRPSR